MTHWKQGTVDLGVGRFPCGDAGRGDGLRTPAGGQRRLGSGTHLAMRIDSRRADWQLSGSRLLDRVLRFGLAALLFATGWKLV